MAMAKHLPKTESPAAKVIRLFGGKSSLARELGIHRSSVGRWDWPKERRGAGGGVPRKHHQKILDLSKSRRLGLRAEDLIGP